MSRFVLTAQLQLQAPTNVQQVVRQIQSQLQGVSVNVQVQGSAQAQRQLQQVTQQTQAATTAAQRMGNAFAVSVKRFAALGVATRAVSLLTSTLSKAVTEAIDFERQLIKVSQVTGKSMSELKGLTREITNLAKGFGVASSDLLNVSTVLSQAGLSADDTTKALRTLAKAALAPNFDSISETAEGAIAILAQFGQGVEALESQLGSINAVAGKFAVEAGDLIDVVRRTGGVFKAAGGDLNELIALFTSVRATTRESAESIGTGLRTIFTRIQRPKTIEYLKRFGIELVDLEGKFVGPYEAIRRLSEALSGLGEGDITFVEIAEQLGGFRQIGKVLPLLQQFSTAQEALNVAQNAGTSLTDDAAKAQQALAVRIAKVQEEFLALIRSISETSTFQAMANTALTLASALIKIGEAIKPLLPLLTAVAAIKFSQNIGGFLGAAGRGLSSGRRFSTGGQVHHFARGGLVPGTGNRDTVPAMLSPGEFVIRKSSVAKIGADNLAGVNKYASGGIVTGDRHGYGPYAANSAIMKRAKNSVSATRWRKMTQDERQALAAQQESASPLAEVTAKKKRKGLAGEIKINPSAIGGFFLRPNKGTERDYNINRKVQLEDGKYALKGKIDGFYTGKNDLAGSSIGKIVREETSSSLRNSIKKVATTVQSRRLVDVPPIDGNEKIFERSVSNLFKEGGAQATIEGYMLEGLVSALSGATLAGGKAAFDYPSSSLTPAAKGRLASIFRSTAEVSSLVKADAKRTGSPGNYKSIGDKLVSDIRKKNFEGLTVKKFAKGGGVGTDTVPALLTPGEFVVNRKSAQSIGYGALNRMNKVGKYANGGVVQHFARGSSGNGVQQSGGITGMGKFNEAILGTTFALSMLTPTIDESSSAFEKGVAKTIQSATTLSAVLMAVSGLMSAFGKELTIAKVRAFFSSGKGGLGDLIGGFQRSGGKTLRGAGQSFSEQFNVGSRIAPQIRQLRKTAGSQGFDPLGLATRDVLKTRIRGLTSQIGGKPTSLTGILGRTLGNAAGRGGITGRLAGIAGQGLTRLGGLGGGALGGAAGAAAAAAGPALAVVGAVAAINSVIGNFRDLDGQLKDAIDAEKFAEAEKLAVAKAASEFPLIGNIVNSIFGEAGDAWLVGVSNFFGGKSVDQVQANIKAQIQSAKATKALEKAQKDGAEAMQKFNAGTASAAEVLATYSAAARESLEARRATEVQARENNLQRAAEGTFTARNIFTLGGLLGETNTQRNRRIDNENKKIREDQKKQEQDVINAAMPGLQLVQRQMAATGGSFEDFKANLRATERPLFDLISASEDGFRKLEEQFNNLAKEAERTRKAFEAMNLGFQKSAAVAGAMSVGLENYLSSQESGNIALENSVRILEASITSAAQGISDSAFEGALADAGNALEELGQSREQVDKFKNNMRAVNTAQKFFAQTSEETKAALQKEFARGAGANSTGIQRKEAFAKVLTDQLAAAGIGEEVRNRIGDAIKGGNISDEDLQAIASGDLSVLEKVLKELGETTLGQVNAQFAEFIKYQKVLVDLTRKRIDAENAVVAAQRNLVDATMESLEIIAKYGGQALTIQDRQRALIAQANMQTRGLRVNRLGQGTGAELNARSAQTRVRLAQINQIRQDVARNGGNGLSGRRGAELDAEEKRLQELAKSDYETTKSLIKLKEEELKLIGEKNKLERSSLESLMKGDVESFFQQQAAVGAQAAIASGSATLQNYYGMGALGAAAEDLKRQQEAGVQTVFGQQLGGAGGLVERAAGAALGAAGVVDPRSAQVFAGTTFEEEGIKAQIRDLAATLPNYASIQLQSAEQGLKTANMQLEAAEKQLIAARANVEARGGAGGIGDAAGGPAMFNRGGPVYANRGIFVPRGTDTIPAMLTPGEFVVNRAAVQRGNNLQVLKAMNRGSGQNISSSSSTYMSNGGMVRYRADGSTDAEAGSSAMANFAQSLNDFNAKLENNIKSLSSVSISLKLDSTNVNVNLNNVEFLNKTIQSVKNAVLQEIKTELNNLTAGDDGRVKRNYSVLNTQSWS